MCSSPVREGCSSEPDNRWSSQARSGARRSCGFGWRFHRGMRHVEAFDRGVEIHASTSMRGRGTANLLRAPKDGISRAGALPGRLNPKAEARPCGEPSIAAFHRPKGGPEWAVPRGNVARSCRRCRRHIRSCLCTRGRSLGSPQPSLAPQAGGVLLHMPLEQVSSVQVSPS